MDLLFIYITLDFEINYFKTTEIPKFKKITIAPLLFRIFV